MMARKPKGKAKAAPKPKKTKATVEKAVASAVVEPVDTKAPRKPGRPTKYTKAIADEICNRMHHGETLNKICRDEHMPGRRTVIDWRFQDIDGFSATYARAREALLDYWEDETVDVADDGTNDYYRKTTKDGEEVLAFNKENVERSKLRVDTRKWMLSKLNQKRFGDKIEQTHKADAGFLDLWKHISNKGDE